MRTDELVAFKEQKASLIAELRDLGAAADASANQRGEAGQWTGEELERFDKTEAEIRSLNERIERGTQLQHHQIWKPDVQMSLDGHAPVSFMEWRIQSENARPWNLPEVRNAFWHYMSTSNDHELDREELRTLSKATGPAGGFLVPTDMYDQVIRAERLMGAVAALATTLTTTGGEQLLVPRNLVHGTAAWVAENAAYTPSDETFDQASLSAFKAGAKVIVSEELLTDSAFGLDSFLAQELGERIGALEADSYVNGDGSGKPAGILHASQSVPVVTAAVGNSLSLTYSALVTAIFALPGQYRRGASFVVADTAARNLYLMVDNQGRPLWSVNVAAGGADTFLGYPITTDPYMPAPAASAKTMIFGNFRRGYMIRRVDGFSLQRQTELHSDNGQVGFRGTERVDGRVVLADALRVIQNSAT